MAFEALGQISGRVQADETVSYPLSYFLWSLLHSHVLSNEAITLNDYRFLSSSGKRYYWSDYNSFAEGYRISTFQLSG